MGDDEKRTDMALFHRNVIVIDASRELVLLSPLLLNQNMSQSRLVTFTKGGNGKAHHAKEWGKFRMTDHNKQSQEVGSQRHLWPLCVSFKQLGRIRVYEKEEKAHIHMHRPKMIRGKTKCMQLAMELSLLYCTDKLSTNLG